MQAEENNKKKLVIFTAPSGAGKTTLVRHLLSKYDYLAFSTSATTRPMREGEVDGKDYYFLTEKEFRAKAKNNEFIEWEEYAGNYYGTLKSEVSRLWEADKVVLFDVEVRGAINIKEMFGDQCLAIFVKAPSIQILMGRLMKRGTESPETFRKRMNILKKEMTFEDRFDKVLVNDKLEVAKQEAEDLVNSFIFEENTSEDSVSSDDK